jgi:hypothetical protein
MFYLLNYSPLKRQLCFNNLLSTKICFEESGPPRTSILPRTSGNIEGDPSMTSGKDRLGGQEQQILEGPRTDTDINTALETGYTANRLLPTRGH